jgi:photosystem II stability/assembly factor-like uncharacterized protein
MRPFKPIPVIFALLFLVNGAQALAQGTAETAPVDSTAYASLRYRYIGPPGNRTIAVVSVPGDPRVYYVGAAAGGIWKTTDGGTHWRPIFDSEPVPSVSALAIAPSNPNVLWAGTGESFIRSHISMGWGAFKSTDAGETWQRVGLEKTGRIARIVIDPRNPDVVLVAALGHSYGPQPDRGIYRTTDGGRSWNRVLFVNDSTGGVDVVMDPNNPDIVFAATWQIEIHTWGRVSGGRGSGIWKSTDGGATWARLAGHGLPTHPYGKVGLAMSRANSKRIYALIETGRGTPWNDEPTDPGALWRSDDGGDSWSLVNSNSWILARPAYYTRLAVEPDDPNRAYFLAIAFSSTSDGGPTLDRRSTAESPGFDNHDMWIDPLNGDRMAVANDEGISLSVNRGRTWTRIRLPIAQLYHVTTDTRIPYTVCGNMQDGPSTCGPSNSKIENGGSITGGADIPRGLWYSVAGGESGWATPDPEDPHIVWSTASGRGSAGGIVVRYNVATNEGRDVEVWPVATFGHAAKDVKFRFVWDFPIEISPHDHNTIYVGSQFVHRTTNGGQSWELISPDLTRNDKTRQGLSGGITPDNLGVEYGDVVYAIAESPVKPGLIWVGSNDGLVHLTQDGGHSWTDLSQNIPGLLPWGTINNIEPSRFDPATAYLTVNGHQVGNFDPWVYRTRDYGKTWSLIVNGIPESPLSYAHCVREDPRRPGLLYLGTENALYVSFDAGDHWQPLQLDLPHAPVSWLTIQRHFDDLVVATFGRGFYILDDLTPLQQLTTAVAASPVHLFEPRPAYRFRLRDDGVREMADDPTAGANPPYGASLNYWLGSAPAGDVTLTIADSSGTPIRILEGTKEHGINRVYWDLRFSPGHERLAGPGGSAGGGGPPAAGFRILAPPGQYTVTLRAAGHEATQHITVLKDPDSGGGPGELAAQLAVLEELSAQIDTSNHLTSSIDSVRHQLDTLLRTVDGAHDAQDLGPRARALEVQLAGLADSLVQQKPGQFYMWRVKLTAQLIYLANHVQSSDRRPTDQALEAHAVLRQGLHLVKTEYERLISHDLADLNAALQRSGRPPIAAPEP